MLFMLVDGQACCEINNDNNNGTSCAEVWFMYERINNESEGDNVLMILQQQYK